MKKIIFFRVDDEEELEIIEEARLHKPFKKIIERDRGSKGDSQGRKKLLAKKELAYIYWEGLYSSHYKIQDDDSSRLAAIKSDLDLPDDWKPDDVVLEGLELFIQSQVTPSMELLNVALEGVKKLKSYIKDIDLQEVVDSGPRKGSLVHSPTEYKKILDSLPATIESLQKNQDLVKKELDLAESTARGGGEIGMYED